MKKYNLTPKQKHCWEGWGSVLCLGIEWNINFDLFITEVIVEKKKKQNMVSYIDTSIHGH